MDYVRALGINEIKWTKLYATPRMNYHRSMESPESIDDFLSLLTRYVTLAPYLVPTNPKGILSKTLSHPDLHLDNVFVDPDTRKIKSIVDWQSSSISEMFLQRGPPPLLPNPKLGSSDTPIGDESEHQNSSKAIQQDRDVLDHYESLTRTSNPRRWAAMKHDHISVLTKPVSLICGAWTREDVFSFRHALISVVANWDEIAPESIPCPINFSESELELHDQEMELIEGLGTIMHQLQDENLIPLGGMVRPEHHERAQDANNRYKEVFISLAEDENQRDVHSKIWPYQEM